MRKVVLTVASTVLAVLLASGIVLLSADSGAQAAPRYFYPNLKTLKPTDLQFDKQGGHYLLRFSNSVANYGRGPLELRGKTVSTSTGYKTRVFQRIYDSEGNYKTTKAVGTFAYHPSHGHMHFGAFAEYQLWTRADYRRWWRAQRSGEEPVEKKGTKTTFCVMDTRKVRPDLPGSPPHKVYRWCGEKRQGLSVGWADTYEPDLPDQFIDLGTAPLADGDYVLRSVADPKNRMYESANKSDTNPRESRINNAAITYFTVSGDTITVTR